jgi:HD-like signal output (HDOD) protein/prolyl-tRNA editing enzyme YbaK/EbsC (Cys-tRNA(Pro) deacylase)
MPVADIIEKVVSKHDLAVTLAEVASGIPSSGATRTTLLEDEEGRLQAIYNADCILDIEVVRRMTGRPLVAVSATDIDALCRNENLQRLPTIPHVLGLTVLIDQRLLEADKLVLDTGSEQRVLKLSKQQFMLMLDDARSGAIAVRETELQTGSLDATEDLQQITSAVANFTQLRIKQRLEETLDFPPLPSTAQRIIKLRADPNADIHSLSKIIDSDPPLAAQVVSWAASPYYAAPGKIKSVHDAIVRVLGFDLVLNLALGLSLDKTLSLPKDNSRGGTPYWKQAVYAATAVEALVTVIPAKHRPVIGMAYLAGLLHNFGYLILAEVFPPQFATYCRYQEANPHSHHSNIERHLLGVSREQMGAWLMRSWNMPDEVCTAMRFQNEPEFDQDNADYANLLCVALRLLGKHGIGNHSSNAIPDDLYQNLNLDPDKAAAAIATMMESADELDMMAANLDG